MFFIIFDNIEIKETFDFIFIDYFQFMKEFNKYNVTNFDWEFNYKNIIDIICKYDIIMNIHADIHFKNLKSHIYDNFK